MGLTANNMANGFSGRVFGLAQGAFSSGMFSAIQNALVFGQSTSVPQGYNSPTAIRMPVRTSGNMSARFRGETALSGSLIALGNLEATLAAEGFLVANGNVGANGYATFAGEFGLQAGASALGSMEAKMDLLARPSAFDIAQEVWNASAAAFAGQGTLGRKLSDAETAAKLAAALSA